MRPFLIAITALALEVAAFGDVKQLGAEQEPRHIHSIVALVAGISEYEKAIPDLRYPRADAEAIVGWLMGLKGIADVDLRVLLDGEATLVNIRAALEWLTSRGGPGRLLLFYFSSHGSSVPDDDGDETDGLDECLVPHDADPDHLAVTCLRDDEIALFLERVRGRIVLIFDCGYIGARDLAGPDRLVLTAAGEGTCSWEDSHLGHGIFTYFLLEGLEKGDRDGDGRLSLQEALLYCRERTQELKGLLWREGERFSEMADGIGELVFLEPSRPLRLEPFWGGGAVAK